MLILAVACGGGDAPTGAGSNGLHGNQDPGGSAPATNPAPATNAPTSATPTSTTTMPATGSGPATGGCPATEPSDGGACDVPGRLCRWARDCGAGGVIGWCTAGKTWHTIAPACQPGCPTWRPTPSLGSQFGPAPDARCTAGLDCQYPSTPIEPGAVFHCSAESDGRTSWSLPTGLNDGWVPAPAASGVGDACGELARCAGFSGCAGACPSPAPTACYCGPDGFQYCEVKAACGGGSATATTHGGP